MQSIAEIEKSISELTAKLSNVVASIERKSNELNSLNRSRQELISRSAGSLKTPKSIAANRAAITLAQQEIEDLVTGKDALLELLQQQQEQLNLANLYSGVGVYQEKESNFFSIFNAGWDVGGIKLKKLLLEWEALVNDLKQAENPILLLLPILTELKQRNLSYKAFIEDGEILPFNPDADNCFLEKLRSKYREPLNAVRDLELLSVNSIGSGLLNTLAWSDGSQLKDFLHINQQQPAERFNPAAPNPNTVRFL